MERVKHFFMVLFEALEVSLGFFMLFSLVFSFAWVLSYFFLDCVFVPLSAFLGDDISAVVQTDLFRSLFCVAVSLFSIFDLILSRLSRETKDEEREEG